MPGNGKVFISHTHADNERCEPLLAALDAWGVDYWFDAQQLDAGQQLTPRLQEAIAQHDVLLRVCTANTSGSYWMNLELSAFRTLQYQERRQRPDKRACIDLVLDTGYTPGALERAEVTIDTTNKPQHIWLKELADALHISRGLKKQSRVSRRSVVGLGGAAAITLASLAGGGAIVKARNDAAAAPYPRPNVIAFSNPQTLDPRIAWYFKAGDDTGCGLALAGASLLVSSYDGLFALTTSDGSVLWSHPEISGSAGSIPVVVGSRCYIAASYAFTGMLAAIDTATGAELWKNQTNSTVGSTILALVNSAIYMLTDDHYVVSYSTRDGSQRWQSTSKIAINGYANYAPAANETGVFIGGDDGFLSAFSPADGSLLWKFQTGGAIPSTVAVDKGVVYFGSKDQYIYAVKASDGSELWRYNANTDATFTPTIAGNTLYSGVNDKLTAIDTRTGAQLWQASTSDDQYISGPVTVAGDVIYTPADTYLYAFSARTRAMAWRFASGGSSYNEAPPVVSGSTAYWSTNSYTVYALHA